jgi:hypothetical protein
VAAPVAVAQPHPKPRSLEPVPGAWGLGTELKPEARSPEPGAWGLGTKLKPEARSPGPGAWAWSPETGRGGPEPGGPETGGTEPGAWLVRT